MDLQQIQRLEQDLRDASRLIGRQEARYLVDLYYEIQQFRINVAGQIRANEQEHGDSEPMRVHDAMFTSLHRLEKNIALTLKAFTEEYTVGLWCHSIKGIAGVLTAGLLAHIDINPWRCVGEHKNPKDRCRSSSDEPCTPACGWVRTITAAKIWRYAGLDPTVQWEKGQIRPWNAELKKLCWKIGESFIKVQNREGAYYGQIFFMRKELEISRNENGDFADQAARILEEKNFKKKTKAKRIYESGKLPPAHINSRARRYAVKRLLSHLQHVMYQNYYGELPPAPYPFVQGAAPDGHTDYREPPRWREIREAGAGRPLTELMGPNALPIHSDGIIQADIPELAEDLREANQQAWRDIADRTTGDEPEVEE